MFIFIHHLRFLLTPQMSSSSTLRKTNFFLSFFSGCKLFQGFSFQGEKIFNFVCDFSLSLRDGIFLLLQILFINMLQFTSDTFNNSHIGYQKEGDREDFPSNNSNLPHHLTNSCFLYQFILLFFWIASFFKTQMNVNSLHPSVFHFHPSKILP